MQVVHVDVQRLSHVLAYLEHNDARWVRLPAYPRGSHGARSALRTATYTCVLLVSHSGTCPDQFWQPRGLGLLVEVFEGLAPQGLVQVFWGLLPRVRASTRPCMTVTLWARLEKHGNAWERVRKHFV